LTERRARLLSEIAARADQFCSTRDNTLPRADLQNIAYGKPEASRDEIIRAARLANAHEIHRAMPEGYDTMVGERGVTLSAASASASPSPAPSSVTRRSSSSMSPLRG